MRLLSSLQRCPPIGGPRRHRAKRKSLYRDFSSAISGRRYYNPSTGRWLSRDPIGELGFVRSMADQMGAGIEEKQTESCPFRRLAKVRKVIEQAIGSGAQSDSLNSYAFVRNAPINLIDPLGLWCGSDNPADIGSDDRVPDHPFGFDFSGACKNHDNCYGTCQANKDTCDKNLLKDAKAACSNSGVANPAFCNLLADIYYYAVTHGGDKAFQEAQWKACELPKCIKAGVPPNLSVDPGLVFGR